MKILESLQNRLPERSEWISTELISQISKDTGLTYESCRCNTFRHLQNLPDWFFKNYKYISKAPGKKAHIIKQKSSKILEFDKNEVYEFLFKNENIEQNILTFCGYSGNDVKYLLENNFKNISCIEKNLKILNNYKKKIYQTHDYLGLFHEIILKLNDINILFYDSCSYFCYRIEKDLILVNDKNINKIFITLQNINNKYCGNNLKQHLIQILPQYNYIDEMIYTSISQKMIVFKFERKIFTQ